MNEFEYQLALEQIPTLKTKISKRKFTEHLRFMSKPSTYTLKLFIHIYELNWDRSETGLKSILRALADHVYELRKQDANT